MELAHIGCGPKCFSALEDHFLQAVVEGSDAGVGLAILDPTARGQLLGLEVEAGRGIKMIGLGRAGSSGGRQDGGPAAAATW